METLNGASVPAGPDRVYADRLMAGAFRIQRCADCARAIFYPRCVCPHCGGTSLDWFEPSGKAVVHATTVVHRKTDQGGNYNVSLVDLDEGVRLMTQVVSVAPETVRIGMRVRAYIDRSDVAARLVFLPEGGTS